MKKPSHMTGAAIAAVLLLVTQASSKADTFDLSRKKTGADGATTVSGNAGHYLRIEDPEIQIIEATGGDGLALSFSGLHTKPAIISFGEPANSASARLKIFAKSSGGDEETILMHPGNVELRRSPKRGDIALYVAWKENEPPVVVRAPFPQGKWAAIEFTISGDDITLQADGTTVKGKLPEASGMAGAKSFFRIGSTQDGKRPFHGELAEITISEPAE